MGAFQSDLLVQEPAVCLDEEANARQKNRVLASIASSRASTVEGELACQEVEKKLLRSKLRADHHFAELYKLTSFLGNGGFSVVRGAVEKATQREWACKIIELPDANSCLNGVTRDDIFREIDVMAELDHENVINFKEYFVEDNKVFMVMELLEGGDLFEFFESRQFQFTEDEVRLCMYQLLRGLEYLHSKNVMHRDIKLENLLLARRGDLSSIKITDFGLATKVMEDKRDMAMCGTLHYVAPEVIMGLRYGTAVDMWSTGVVLYLMLSGFLPFSSPSKERQCENIRRGIYSFRNDPVWANVSDRAKDLIWRLLLVDPRVRLTATAALCHPWFHDVERAVDPRTDFTPCDEPAGWSEPAVASVPVSQQ